jgi:hypothetical protein
MAMSTQVTLTLQDNAYERAEQLAKLSGRDISDVLTVMLQASLPPLDALLQLTKPTESLSNQEILLLANSRMDAAQNQRMSMLLEKQQSGDLDEVERYELSLLLHAYQEGSLRKAQALAEAVQRGLLKSENP